MDVPHFVCAFISWWTFGSFPPFGCCEWCGYEHWCTRILFESLFSVLLGTYLGGELLSHMVILYLALGNANLLSTAAEPFYIFSSNV